MKPLLWPLLSLLPALVAASIMMRQKSNLKRMNWNGQRTTTESPRGLLEGVQRIESFHVTTDIRYRFATTTMCSVVRNTQDVSKELTFNVSLPKEAFIVEFNMMIDGKDYKGEVKEKEKAKKQYDAAIERGESAGHIKQAPREANKFDMSVNVAGGKSVNFTLVYQEMLSRKKGQYEYEMHVDPGQAVEDFKVEVTIFENRPLTFVKTPELRTKDLLTNKAEVNNEIVIVDRPTNNSAIISYYPTVSQQGPNGLSARFVVQYDVEHAERGTVLVADGYFIHLFAPQPAKALPKDIVFVLDTSGSMSGTKIAQLKTAMMTILKDLQDEDRFNILKFSSNLDSMSKELLPVTPDNLRRAKRFVERMHASGGTNINEALLWSLRELQRREAKESIGMVFFLTDGQATSGETDNEAIKSNIKMLNQFEETAIYSLGFGSGADYKLLKTISTQNFGFARKIYEASDAALQVERLYSEISLVAMKGVAVDYLPTKVTKTTETEFPVVPVGGEVVICGQLLGDPKDIAPRIKATDENGEVEIEQDPDDIIDISMIGEEDDTGAHKDYRGILEKVWAYLTIKQMLKEKDALDGEEEKKKELDNQTLELSLKYQFVTPLTSMVVTKPMSNNERIPLQPRPVNDAEADLNTPTPLSSQYNSRRKSFASIHGPQHGIPDSFPGMNGIPPPDLAYMMLLSRSGNSHQHRRVHHSGSGVLRSRANRKRVQSLAGVMPFLPMTNTAPPTTTTTTTTTTHVPTSITSTIPATTTTTTTHVPTLTTSTIPTTTTTPPTTTKTTTATTKKPKNKRKYRKRNAKFAVLTSMIVKDNTSSMCFSPRKARPGNYTLAKFFNGVSIEITTHCLRKRCLMVLRRLSIDDQSSASKEMMSFERGGNSFLQTHDLNDFVLTTSDMEIRLSRRLKGRRMLVSLQITMKTPRTTVMDAIKMLRFREIKYPRIPRGCRNTKTDRTAILYLKKI